MRRSAAPSQMTGSCGSVPSAKRQKFVAPVYRPYHGSSSSNQTTHCQSQNDSVRCKDNKDKVDLSRSSSSLDARSTLPSVIPRQTSLFNKVIKDNASVNAQTCLRRASGDNDNHKNGSFCLQDSAGGRNDASLPSSCSNEVERDISTITSLTRRTVKRNEEGPSAINLENVSPATDHGSCLHPQDSVVPLQPHQGETMPLPLTDAHNTLNEKKEISSSTSSTRYFSVVWCKLSKKKHKKWEGDAILSTSGRSAILYDTEGKIIGRGSGYKIAELESLKEDETLVVGGKEIQVMSLLTEEQFKSGKCFSDASASVDHSLSTVEASGTVRSSGVSKPFSNPLLKSGQHGKQFQVNNDTVNKQSLVPRNDPSAPDALVMPRPSPDHQWKHNKHGQAVVDVVVDPYLSTSLRSHQRTGVVFLYECIMGMRDYYGQGAILADDMGLGKTLQCISLIWTLLKQGPYGGQPVVKKVLVVTPGSLVKNWFLEFKKWLGTERLNVFAVAADKRVDDFVKSTLHPVLVISYEMFVRCHEVIKEVPFDLIICDEGHRLKNTAIKTTSLIMSLPCRKRIVLTGTPVQNDLQEFYSIVEFCNPGILGSSAAFRRVYEEPIVASRQPKASAEQQELGMERAQELTRLTQMFVLRRTQEINNDYLPPKVELVLFCRPTSLQLSIYRQLIRSSVIRRCLAGNLAGSPHLICIGALKQLCNHPGLVYRKAAEAELKKEGMQAHSQHGGLGQGSCDRWEDSIYDGLLSYFPDTFDASTVSQVDSGKLEVLSGLLSAIFAHSSSEKVVLVSNHTKTLDFLQVFCDLHGYSYLRLDGGTPTSQRQDVVNRFNNNFSPHRVFLLSSKAGGVGLNLIGASRLILYDIDWNPANDLQAMARVWRDGQKRKVHIYRLLTVGTIEEKIYQRQITKQGLSGAVMDLSNKNDVQFSLEDLKDLFSLNEKTACETHSMLDCHCEGDPALVHEKPTTEAVAEDRQCQLGKAAGVARKNRVTNLTMAKLLHWNHWRGEFVSSQKVWYLDAVGPLLSFVFWHETSEN